MAICDRCGTESPPGFLFCGACGAKLPEAVETHDTRKIVTALFCDVAGSTALGEELDPEALHEVINRYFKAISATVERHGGTVQKFGGDSVLAVFGIPRVHEDDALRAVRAAEEISECVPLVAEQVGVPLRFRTGVNTGLVMTDPGKSLALGDAVNVAARLEQAAQPGEILLGAETLRLVRGAVEVEPLEPLTLKGKSKPVPAFRLLRVDPVAPGHVPRAGVPLVGRDAELRQLREGWDRTVAESRCEVVTLLGAAGVGKSRLVEELLLGDVGDRATALRGRCLHYGEGITFWPIVEALTPLGADSHAIRDRLSTGGIATPGELFVEVRRYLEGVAAERPLILHVDDLHWAEPMLIELLGDLAEGSRSASILVLCTARPDLLEEHPEWGSAENSTIIEIDPLGGTACERLLEQLGDELGTQARARVIEMSEGNPLFLQEMVVLAREGQEVEIPPTIQALLAARLERLTSHERHLLERGAIEGQVFHRSAVQTLASPGPASHIDSLLASLIRKDLIRPHPANVAGDRAFRFRHLLIRDAAYERLPKAVRAELHERCARWLEATTVDFVEVDEIAGWHLEQAVRHASELGHDPDASLRCRATEHLYAAGRRAGERSDVAAARSLLERALSLVPGDDPLRGEVSVALADRLIESGDLARADELLSYAEHDHDESGSAALSRLEWLLSANPREAARAIESALPPMLERVTLSEDDRLLAKAHMLAFWARWTASRATLAAEEVRLAAEHGRRAGDIGLWSRALGWYVATLIYGPRHATEVAAELDAIAHQEMGPYLTAFVRLGRGEVDRLQGQFEQALGTTRRAAEDFRALGMHTMVATCQQMLASIELSQNEPAAALSALSDSEAIFAEAGENALRSTTQATLARTYELLGQSEAAQAALELAEQLSAPQDLANFAITHGVRARLALATGDCDAAQRWASSGVVHAMRTDFVGVQADATLGLARVASSCGEEEQATAEAQRAKRLYEAKGDLSGIAAAGELLLALER